MGLIEALEGRLGILRGAGAAAAAARLGPGRSGGGGGADVAPTAPAEPQPDIHPPEPEAEQLSQLADMGFTDAVARKALVLSRNR